MPTFRQTPAVSRLVQFLIPGQKAHVPATIFAVNDDGTCDLLVSVPVNHSQHDPRNLAEGRSVYAAETYLVEGVQRGFGSGTWHFHDDSPEDPKPVETQPAPVDPVVAQLAGAVTQPKTDAPAAPAAA